MPTFTTPRASKTLHNALHASILILTLLLVAITIGSTLKGGGGVPRITLRSGGSPRSPIPVLTPPPRTTYYEVLGVSLDATDAELKRAFRQRVKSYHPDKSMGKEALGREMARQRFEEVRVAYEVLTSDRRCAYDWKYMKSTLAQRARCLRRQIERDAKKWGERLRDEEDKRRKELEKEEEMEEEEEEVEEDEGNENERRRRKATDMILYRIGAIHRFVVSQPYLVGFYEWLMRTSLGALRVGARIRLRFLSVIRRGQSVIR